MISQSKFSTHPIMTLPFYDILVVYSELQFLQIKIHVEVELARALQKQLEQKRLRRK